MRAMGEWNAWFADNAAAARNRKLPVAMPTNLALALLGVRRCGKTFASLCLSRDIVEKTLYFNFEDPITLASDSPMIFERLVDLFEEQRGEIPHRVILDEVQQVPRWERWVRKVVDLNRFELIITGSNSMLLSSELGASVTGRVIEQPVWPLSFAEYLEFRSERPNSEAQFRATLGAYLRWGGFPKATLTTNEAERVVLLKQYLRDIVARDVSHRHAIRDARKLDRLVSWYLTNVACLHSYNAIKKAFGLAIDTSSEYTRYLSEAFLVFEVHRYHPNLKVQARDPKKVYIVDNGLRTVSITSDRVDWGCLAENAVYIELRRRGCDVAYFKGKQETDFIITELGNPVDAIQVTYGDFHGTTREREVAALVEALHSVGLSSGKILTREEQDRLTVDGCEIWIVPLHQWLLEQPAS